MLDLTGQVFGRLTVIHEVPRPEDAKTKCKYYLCRCTCGNEVITDTGSLRNDKGKRSCGCAVEERNEKMKKPNKYDLSGEYGICYSNNSDDIILFDLEDYDKIKDYGWHVMLHNRTRLYKTVSATKNKKLIRMHRLILGVDDPSIIIDHINRNPLDNRKSNLRFCTMRENAYNSGAREGRKYKGVCKYRDGKRWVAKIGYDGNDYHIGIFNTPEEAALAYNEKAKEFFGEFAYLNEVHMENEINTNKGEILNGI